MDQLSRRIKLQLLAFVVASAVVVPMVLIQYMRAPATYLGIGRYTVTVQLPESGNLYKRGNVVYRGVEVGRITDVRLTDTGAEAVLSLKSDVEIPADLDVGVRTVSAVGEPYVELVPRSAHGPTLKNGDVISADRASIQPQITSILAAAVRGVDAIPRDDLETLVDESYSAVGGLGPELSRLLKSTTTLTADARKNVDSIVTLIDDSKPLLDSQVESGDAVQAWAAHMANVTAQLKNNDPSVEGVLQNGSRAVSEAQQLIERLQPSLPTALENLVPVGQTLVVYRDSLEALLVEVPQGTAMVQAINVPNKDVKHPLAGAQLSFNLNLFLPPACLTGWPPATQMRAPAYEDVPELPEGKFYCRIPQDSTITGVRGARNLPCITRPGKRAPTVEICESDEEYVPLNDGFNWKGDPNATLTGQDIPQMGPGEAPLIPGPPAPPIAALKYDSSTGLYIGPDGRRYTASDVAGSPDKEESWQSMMMPGT